MALPLMAELKSLKAFNINKTKCLSVKGWHSSSSRMSLGWAPLLQVLLRATLRELTGSRGEVISLWSSLWRIGFQDHRRVRCNRA